MNEAFMLSQSNVRLALIQAVEKKDVLNVEKIITKNRELLEIVDEAGQNILHRAASISNNHAIIEVLCTQAKEANIIQYPSKTDHSGSTPAHYAVEIGCLDNFKVLLDFKSNINITRLHDQTNIKDLIVRHYSKNNELYLDFMFLLVMSPKGKEYFNFRHNVSPSELNKKDLIQSLKIDMIADQSTDYQNHHLAALKYCLTQLRVHNSDLNTIKLMISHLSPLYQGQIKCYPAIDIANIFSLYDQTEDTKLTAFSKDLVVIFSKIKLKLAQFPEMIDRSSSLLLATDLNEKDYTIEKVRFIEGEFLLQLQDQFHNVMIQKLATMAAVNKFINMKNPSIAFKGLEKINAQHLYIHDAKKSDLAKFQAAMFIAVHFLRDSLYKRHRDLKYYVKKYITLPIHKNGDRLDLIESMEGNIDKILLEIVMLEEIIHRFENLTDVNEISILIDQFDLVFSPEELVDKIKQLIENKYISKISSIHLDDVSISRILSRVDSPFIRQGDEAITKISLITIPTMKNTLKKLFIKNGFIKDPQKGHALEIVNRYENAYALIQQSIFLRKLAYQQGLSASDCFTTVKRLAREASSLWDKNAKLGHAPSRKMLELSPIKQLTSRL